MEVKPQEEEPVQGSSTLTTFHDLLGKPQVSERTGPKRRHVSLVFSLFLCSDNHICPKSPTV